VEFFELGSCSRSAKYFANSGDLIVSDHCNREHYGSTDQNFFIRHTFLLVLGLVKTPRFSLPSGFGREVKELKAKRIFGIILFFQFEIILIFWPGEK